MSPRYLKRLLGFTDDQVADAISGCLESGLLAETDEGDFLMVGWDSSEWGNPKSTERVRRHRERNVTKRDETVSDVSQSGMKRGNAEESRGDKSRGEEKRDTHVGTQPSSPARGVVRKKPKSSLVPAPRIVTGKHRKPFHRVS